MSEPALHNEKALLRQVAEGDEQAFRKIFDHYWDHIYSVALAFTKTAALAEETAQDIFLKIWLGRERLAVVKKFDSYLFTLARNHILNTLRKKVREEPYTEYLIRYFEDTTGTPEQLLMWKDASRLLKEAVAGLSVRQKEIWQLSRMEGLNQEQIAGRLQISVHSVKSHMNKALRAIRHYLQAHSNGVLFLMCSLLSYWKD